jgi:hypothetical protein
MNVTGGIGSAPSSKRNRGLDSTRPTQDQEGDLPNTGGTAPGGVVAFMGQASQWSESDAASHRNGPVSVDPAMKEMALHAAGQSKDVGPEEKGDVPVHPGLAPGLFRTARDANYDAPDGETNTNTRAAETGSHPLSPDGKYRGESPEIEKNPRGSYRP